MNSKTLKIILSFIILVLLIINLSYWADAVYNTDNNDFLYNVVFFWLTGIAFLCSFYFLVVDVKKINNKASMTLIVIILVGGFILNKNFGGTSTKIENKVIGIFSEPIMWLLIATLIGHLVLFIYKRNKPQSN